ncbi:hypothetical protein EVAR_97107_1 [Eumeta japonica]|uniref:Uncharacterized protein n=1 Tax=Eumeta variegata TaxID=151549 RepID=A0A4C1X6B5_EUMVA|nr:hypothetical protein EVAR_97107_1 [Eumeta japonica]
MESESVLRQTRLDSHNGVPILMLMYGSRSWVRQKRHESRISVVEMRFLRIYLQRPLDCRHTRRVRHQSSYPEGRGTQRSILELETDVVLLKAIPWHLSVKDFKVEPCIG